MHMNLFEITNEPVLEALYDFNEQVDDVLSECYITEALLESCNDPDILFEADSGAKLKEIKDKVVKFFKELWEKLKKWFNDIITKIKGFFNGHKKFLQVHGTEIAKNFAKKPVTVPEFKIYVPALICKASLQIIENMIADAVVALDVYTNKSGDAQESFTNDEIKEYMFNNVLQGVNTGVKIKDNVKLESVDDIRTFVNRHVIIKKDYTVTKDDIDDMKHIIENENGYINWIQKDRAALQNIVDQIIRDVNQEINDKEGYSHIAIIKRINTYILNTVSNIPPIAVNYVQVSVNYCTSFLKKFVTSESK